MCKFWIRTLCILLYSFFSGCSYFTQNDLVETVKLIEEASETIFYEVYQTDIDNYRFDFKAKYENDTIKLFEYILNDAIYTAIRLKTTIQNNQLIIKINLPTARLEGKTKRGKTVILQN